MSGGGGIITGMLALAALDATVSSLAAAGRVGGLADVIATGFERFVSPGVPAIGVHGQSTHPYSQAASTGTVGTFAGTTATGSATTSAFTTKVPVPASPAPATVQA